MHEEEKAPLADMEIAAGEELTLADLERLHGVSALETETFYHNTLEVESTLHLSEALQEDTVDDLQLAMAHQRIEIPENSTGIEIQDNSNRIEMEKSVPEKAELLIQIGTDTFDLSKKDDIAWFEQQFQALFSQALYPYLQRLSRLWNSEAEIGGMYQQLESLSRERAPVAAIIDLAQQISVYRDMIEKERLTPHEIEQTLNHLALLQEVLQRYQRLFESFLR